MDTTARTSRLFEVESDYNAFSRMRREAVEALAVAEQWPEARPVPVTWPTVEPDAGDVVPDSIVPNLTAELPTFRPPTRGLRAESLAKGLLFPQCEPCHKQEAAFNAIHLQRLRGMTDRVVRITAVARVFDASTKDNTQLVAMMDEHDRQPRVLSYVACDPYCDLFDKAFDKHDAFFRESFAAATRAMDQVFSNAKQRLAGLRGALIAVRDQRTAFESSSDGAGGIEALTRVHQAFLSQLSVCRSFRLASYVVGANTYNAEEYYAEVLQLQSDESEFAAIDELDRLRDEYVQKVLRPVPPPFMFSQTKASKRFTFAELNKTNLYSWALLTDILLENLDAIADAMDKAGFPIQLNSVYRNPMSSDGRSQHQYGRACDWQVFDFNESGGPTDEADWTLLKDLIKGFAPPYIEPFSLSGVGHVHADWRGVNLRPFETSGGAEPQAAVDGAI